MRTSEVDTCSFTFETSDTSIKPVEGQEIIVTDGVSRIFGGHIVSAPETEEVVGHFSYNVECVDYQRQLDRYLVVENYSNM